MRKAIPARKPGGTSVKMKAVGSSKPRASDRKRQKKGKGSDTAAMAKGSGERSSAQGRADRPAGGGDKRKRQTRISLAVEFTVPVCVVIGVVIVVWGLVIRSRMQNVHLNEIKKNGASNVKALADIGRAIIRDKRLNDTDWPLQGGWVSANEWKALTNGSTPQQALRKARVLSRLTYYTDPKQRNEVLIAYILTRDNGFVASTHEYKDKVEITGHDWFGRPITPDVKIGHNKVRLGEVQVAPAVVASGNQTQKAFSFEAPIRDGSGLLVGTALLALRGATIQSEQSALTQLMLGIGLVAMVLAAVVCVVIATTVTRPVKMLIQDMEIVSRGNLDHKTRAHSQDEIGQMAVEFNEMTRKLAAAHEAEKETERLENELDMAREIQTTLLPKGVPTVGGFDIDAVYKPAREVGGDYYDFYPIGTKVHLGIIVADVSGKSVPGAMQMATTRTILRFIAAGNTSAADTLAKTNAIVAQDIKRGMFVTAFYVVLDAKNRMAICASAGHNPMVVVRSNGSLDLVNPSGIALGFDKGPIFQRTIKEQALQLAVGDRVVLYTDGVVEAMNAKNEEYTPERFYEYCKKERQSESKVFIEGLLADLDAHKGKAEQHDDITVVTFKVM